MHILFVDESGTPPKPGKDHPRYFVVGGIIIPENLWHRLRDALFGMKVRRRIRGEFKWRYFAPDNDDAANPLRHLSQAERDDIREEIYRIITAERGVTTMAAVCSAVAAYRMPSVNDQEDLYHLTYKTVTERFQYHLQDLSHVAGETIRGMTVADHRGAGDDKRLSYSRFTSAAWVAKVMGFVDHHDVCQFCDTQESLRKVAFSTEVGVAEDR